MPRKGIGKELIYAAADRIAATGVQPTLRSLHAELRQLHGSGGSYSTLGPILALWRAKHHPPHLKSDAPPAALEALVTRFLRHIWATAKAEAADAMAQESLRGPGGDETNEMTRRNHASGQSAAVIEEGLSPSNVDFERLRNEIEVAEEVIAIYKRELPRNENAKIALFCGNMIMDEIHEILQLRGPMTADEIYETISVRATVLAKTYKREVGPAYLKELMNMRVEHEKYFERMPDGRYKALKD